MQGVPVSGAWCMESAALVAPLTNRAPVTHHKTVVRTCQWCAETKFPAGINLVQTVAPDWRRIESLMALDLIKIPAVSALLAAGRGVFPEGRGRGSLVTWVKYSTKFS